MKVKALKPGFFNGSRVREGQTFEVPDGTKGSWFAPVAPEVKAKSAKSKAKSESSEPEQPGDEVSDAI